MAMFKSDKPRYTNPALETAYIRTCMGKIKDWGVYPYAGLAKGMGTPRGFVQHVFYVTLKEDDPRLTSEALKEIALKLRSAARDWLFKRIAEGMLAYDQYGVVINRPNPVTYTFDPLYSQTIVGVEVSAFPRMKIPVYCTVEGGEGDVVIP